MSYTILFSTVLGISHFNFSQPSSESKVSTGKVFLSTKPHFNVMKIYIFRSGFKLLGELSKQVKFAHDTEWLNCNIACEVLLHNGGS